MATMTGGCLCGRVRYTLTGDPIRSYVCHCRDCQRASGAAFAPGLGFPVASLDLLGELKTFDLIGGSSRRSARAPTC